MGVTWVRLCRLAHRGHWIILRLEILCRRHRRGRHGWSHCCWGCNSRTQGRYSPGWNGSSAHRSGHRGVSATYSLALSCRVLLLGICLCSTSKQADERERQQGDEYNSRKLLALCRSIVFTVPVAHWRHGRPRRGRQRWRCRRHWGLMRRHRWRRGDWRRPSTARQRLCPASPR